MLTLILTFLVQAAPPPALLVLTNTPEGCRWDHHQTQSRRAFGTTPGLCPSPVQIEWNAADQAFIYPDAAGTRRSLSVSSGGRTDAPKTLHPPLLSLAECQRTAPGSAKPTDDMLPFDIMGKTMGGELPCAAGCNNGEVHAGIAFLQGPKQKLMIFQYGTPQGIMSALPALAIVHEPLTGAQDVKPLPFSRAADGAEALYQCRGNYVHATWHSMQTQSVGSQLVDGVKGETVIGPLDAVAVLWP